MQGGIYMQIYIIYTYVCFCGKQRRRGVQLFARTIDRYI